MASAHPDSAKHGAQERHRNNPSVDADTAIQDLYAAYGTETETPPEMLDLARQAAAALSARGTGADDRPPAPGTTRDGCGSSTSTPGDGPDADDIADTRMSAGQGNPEDGNGAAGPA